MKIKITAVVIASLTLVSTAAFAEMWIPFDVPGSVATYVSQVYENIVVGEYVDSSYKQRGFVYDSTNWTTLHYPGSYSTGASAYEGGTIFGSYSSPDYASGQGFKFDGTSYTPITYPGASRTIITDTDNGIIAGRYVANYIWRSFIYDGVNWTSVDGPGALQTNVMDVDNGKVVGYWNYDLDSDPLREKPSYNEAFIYDGTNWTFLNYPGATHTSASGIDGDTIVGSYSNTSSGLDYHGFIYDGTDWTSLDFPGAAYTSISGIEGDTIWGYYKDSVYGPSHGFIYVVPEPTTMLLFAVGGLMVRRKK